MGFGFCFCFRFISLAGISGQLFWVSSPLSAFVFVCLSVVREVGMWTVGVRGLAIKDLRDGEWKKEASPHKTLVESGICHRLKAGLGTGCLRSEPVTTKITIKCVGFIFTLSLT